MLKWPFQRVKWPPTRERKGHLESPGSWWFEPIWNVCSARQIASFPQAWRKILESLQPPLREGAVGRWWRKQYLQWISAMTDLFWWPIKNRMIISLPELFQTTRLEKKRVHGSKKKTNQASKNLWKSKFESSPKSESSFDGYRLISKTLLLDPRGFVQSLALEKMQARCKPSRSA